MNILPTSPHQTFTDKDIDQYFNDMKRWNYDVAYNAFYAFPIREVLGKFKNSYMNFAEKAKQNGFKACVQIQSTVGNLEDVSIEHAQHFLDNSTHVYEHHVGTGKINLFGSFASAGWLEYLKKISTAFRELGFEWVVYEEPMFHVDIPGTKDKFYEIFKKAYPNLNYPTKQIPCLEYYKVQELKQKVLTDFYDNLTSYAKEIGFEKIGIMPWFFSPTFENTPIETWSSSCDTAKITFLKNLDFIIVRMQPDNIRAEAMIASSGESLPRLAYTEVLAHSLGKPTIMVNNPTNEHTPPGMDNIELIPMSYFKKYTLSAFAGVPSGMSRHWYGKNYEEDKERMALLTDINKYLPKFGKAVSPIAFLFSTRSQTRLVPRSWKDVWKIYWNFAQKLQFEAKIPFITIFADRLKDCFQNHPEIKIIFLSEYFPLSDEEIAILKKWIKKAEDRFIIYLGSRNGYRYNENPTYYSFDWRPTEILSLFDVDLSKPITQFAEDDLVELEFSGKNITDAFLGKKAEIECSGYGLPAFKKDNKFEWINLYKTVYGNHPIIRMKKNKGEGTLLFSGLSLDSPNSSFPILNFVQYALKKIKSSSNDFPVIKNTSRSILWNMTSLGYIAISNISNKLGKYEISNLGANLWDVKNSKLLKTPCKFNINSLDFHVYKIIEKGSNLLDIDGMVYLTNIDNNKDRIQIKGFFNKKIIIKTSSEPIQIKINDKNISFSAYNKKTYIEIDLDNYQIGDVEIKIRF